MRVLQDIHRNTTQSSIFGNNTEPGRKIANGRCANICVSTYMMTSSNGNIFRVTGPLCGEFTGPGEFPAQRPVTGSFDVFFYLRLNKRLSKQQWGGWFEMPSWSLWRQCNDSLELRLKHMNITRSIKDELGTYVTFWAKQKQPKFNFPLAVRCISWIFSLNIASVAALHSTNSMLLTHWGRTKWTLSWQKMLEFRFKFHRNFFLLTINRHWFRYWLGIG